MRKKLIPAISFCLLLIQVSSFAQSCECTNCPGIIPAGPTSLDFDFDISGAVNNDLSDPGQGVCGVLIEFQHSFIFQIEMTLTSPGGQSVDLIGTSFIPPLGSFTGGALWDIAFLPCVEPVVPDTGFPPIWNNDEAWSLGGQYTGSYYPHMGCLEDFNTGVVDGTWTLTVTNDNGFYTGEILDFEIIFCDTTGMGCFSCVADAGDLSTVAAIEACEGDSTNLSLNITPTYTGSPPDTLEYSYTWVVSQSGIVLAYDTIPNLSAYEDGIYQVCGLSYLTNDSLLLPAINGTLTLDELDMDIGSLSPSFCGDLSDTCVTVVILSNSSSIVDTICAGDSYAYDGQSLDTTGVYTFNFPSTIGCVDSTVTIDLLVLDSIFTQVQDTICFGDSSSIAGQYFFTTGIHYATLPASQVNCDSIIELDLVVQDTSFTMLVESICIGDTLWVGGTPFDTTGNYSVTLTNLLGCDSLVELQLSLIDTAVNDIQVAICNGAMYSAGGMDYDSTGMYQINLPGVANCDSLINLDLTVLNPEVSIDLPDTIDCNQTSFNLNGTVTATNSNTVINFQWTHLDNGSDGIIADANTLQPLINKGGMYQLEVTETFLGVNCVNSVVVEVINDEAIPDVNISPVGDITCVDSIVMLSANSSVSPLSYSWTGPLGFSSNQADTTTNIEGTYYVEVTASNGCNNIDSISIGIDTLSPPLTLLVNDTLDCVTDSVQLQSMSIVTGLTYAWSSPGGYTSTAANPYTQVADTYTLIVTAPNGCSTTETVVVVADEVIPDLILSTDTLTCEIDSVQLQSMSIVTGLTYAWSSPGGYISTVANPYTQVADTYTLVVTAPNGCSATETVVVVADEVIPDLTLSTDTLTCEIDSVQLQSMSTVTGLTYAWSSPGGYTSTVANPYTQVADTYTLIVTAPNGCSTTETVVVVADENIPDLTLSTDTLTCEIDSVQLQSMSTVTGLTYTWSSPGGYTSTVANPYTQVADTYTLIVTAPNGCSATETVVVVADENIPDLTLSTDTLTCEIDSVQLQSMSTVTGLTYTWSSPGGFASTVANPYTQVADTYTLVVTAPNGCSATETVAVEADENIPDLTLSTDTLTCEIDSVQLQSMSTVTGLTYAWSSPGGYSSTVANPYTQVADTYTLVVTAPNGCSTTETVVVEADENIPDLTLSTDTLTCEIDSVQLQSMSTVTGLTYAWSSPGGYTSTVANPYTQVADTYTLIVTAPNGCSTTETVAVEADENIPDLTLSTDTLTCEIDSVQLQSMSTVTGLTYTWSSPGGYTSTVANPYTQVADTYTLIVTAPNGCSTTETVVVVADENIPDLTLSTDTLTCEIDSVQLQSMSTVTGLTYAWSSPGGFSSTAANPYTQVADTYTLVVTAPNGCSATETVVVVADENIPDLTLSTDTLTCEIDSVQLQSMSTVTGLIYAWSSPGGYTSTLANPYTQVTDTYTLVVTAPNGCSATETVVVEADENIPDLSLSTDTLTCEIDSVQLQSMSTVTGLTYAWSSPGGYTSTLANPYTQVTDTYTLVVTAPNGCSATETVVVVADENIPDLALSTDTLTCEIDSVQLQSMSTVTGLTYVWSSPGGFTSTLANPYAQVADTYTLVVTAPNGCSATETVVVEADENIPDLSLSTDTLTCEIDSVQLQSMSTVTGLTYAWSSPGGYSSTVANPYTQVADTYTLIVTAPNGCSATETVVVEADENIPDLSLSTDTLTCEIDSVQLQSMSTVTGLTYAWSSPGGYTSTLANPYTQVTDTYTLVVTAPNGCSATETVVVVADENIPDLALSTDTLTCEIDSVQLQSMSTVTGLTYVWSSPGGFTSTVANPYTQVADTYTLVVTAPNGCSATETVVVEADENIPDLTLSTDTLTCEIDSVQLQSMSTVTGLTYAWSSPGGFTSAVANPYTQVADTYTLVVTAPNGCSATETVVVEADENIPDLTLSTDTLTCEIDSVQLQSMSTVTGLTYAWSSPGGFTSTVANPYTQVADTYTLVVTAPNGCSATETVVVEADENIPDLTLSTDTLTCEIDSVQLQSMSTVTGLTYAWSSPGGFTSTVANPYTQIADVYTLIVTTPGGCSATEGIVVTQDTISPDLSLEGGTISCDISEVQLIVNSTVGNLEYSWTGPGSFTSNDAAPMVMLPGFYTLVVSAPNGCTASQMVEVIGDLIPPQSVISDTNGAPLDCINLSVLLSGENSNPQNNVLHQWWDQSNLLSMADQLEVTTGGTYQLIVENTSNGCLDTSQIVIDQDIEMPVVIIEQADSISCESNSITIDASNSSNGNGYENFWFTSSGNILSGENSLTPVVDAAGIYVLTITNTDNGCTATETVSISNSANDILIGYIDWKPPSCFGENDGLLLIDSVSGGTAPYVYSFNESDFTTLSFFGNLGAGTYPLQIEDAAGCVFDTLFTLSQPSPIQVSLGEDQTVQLGDSVEFEAQVFLSASALDTFVWSNTSLLNCNTCLEQSLTPLQTISFTITAFDQNGCSDSDDILIRVVKDRLVYVPNAFSPNGDGKNDVFMINAGLGVERINTLRIFDRFGELLFKADDFDPNDQSYSWDGTLKGEPLNPQVLVYYFKVTYTDGWSEVVKGDITILK